MIGLGSDKKGKESHESPFSLFFQFHVQQKSKVLHLIEGCSEIDRHNLTSRTGARERESDKEVE